jgi:HSP20 family protein
MFDLVKRDSNLMPRFFEPDFSRSFSDMLDRFFDDWPLNDSHTPATNVFKTKDGYCMELALPGITKDDIEVEQTDKELRIRCKVERETEDKDATYYRKGFVKQSFEKVYAITPNTEITASELKNGVLKISFATPDKEKEKKLIEIQ